jgi:hypothetical protein
MRCQRQTRNGYGQKRCKYDAEEGATICWSCAKKDKRKQKNAIATALGKPGKNPGWRDPELRAYVRGLPCILHDHPLHRCGALPDRYDVEACHVVTKAHAGDHDNLYPGCPVLHDEQEGRTKACEGKYGVSFKAIAKQITTDFLAMKGLTV